MLLPGVDFTKSRKSKINRKCYRKCDFQAFDWLKFTLMTDLRLTTFCEIDPLESKHGLIYYDILQECQ